MNCSLVPIMPALFHRLGILSWLFLMSAQLIGPSSAWAQSDRGNPPAPPASRETSGRLVLSGTVVDAQGRGIAGALISLAIEGSSGSHEVDADSTGHFSIGNLLPGRYKLAASANGFQALTKSVEIGSDGAPDLTLKLDVGTVQSDGHRPRRPLWNR